VSSTRTALAFAHPRGRGLATSGRSAARCPEAHINEVATRPRDYARQSGYFLMFQLYLAAGTVMIPKLSLASQ
jgi:hypothetical protein